MHISIYSEPALWVCALPLNSSIRTRATDSPCECEYNNPDSLDVLHCGVSCRACCDHGRSNFSVAGDPEWEDALVNALANTSVPWIVLNGWATTVNHERVH